MRPDAIKVGFIGAGRRATSAHYPAVARIADARINAICDLDADRLRQTADRYGVEGRYTDHRQMLEHADLDAVYIIMAPQLYLPLILNCLSAGKHVFVEKPPAMSVRDLETMIEAAQRRRRLTAVCFQRRLAAVTQEIRRQVLARGPVTLCLGAFHKNLLSDAGPGYGFSTLHDDIVHAVDFVCYMCGGEAVEVHAFQDRLFASWKNSYNALVRFDNGAVGMISGNRASGGRVLRFEVHGCGIGAYIDMPSRAEILVDNPKAPTVLTGAELVGSTDEQDYEGTLAVHRDFIDSIRLNRATLTSFETCLSTMRLVERMEGE
ncbi:MAG TPA: Gfo/Idh/MocA family oxidoreductase [Chloroflexota bacterium]|nr:Gfo/Idh/MocA family oxidoreductase [Chloroflexota bacterium]